MAAGKDDNAPASPVSQKGDMDKKRDTIANLSPERLAALAAQAEMQSQTPKIKPPSAEEMNKVWQERCDYLVYGLMTTDLCRGDERELSIFVNDGIPVGDDKLPADFPAHNCQKGFKGAHDKSPNQDNFSVSRLKDGYTIACIMDGHGPDGHHTATACVQYVPYYLLASENFPSNIPAALVESFEKAHAATVAKSGEEGFDISISGATAVAMVFKDGKGWSATCGDSRGLVASSSSRKVLFTTEDQKPTDPKEIKRIESMGGEIREQYYSPKLTTYRVYVKGKDYPGIAMTRSLGDESVKAVGVIATPEVAQFEIDMDQNPFLFMGSDGIFEFQSNDVVAKGVAKKIKSESPQKIVNRIRQEAVKRWEEEEFGYCDDITAVLFKLAPE
eukprot:TRINITY_DN46587_c0_g1_i1.p1 TRINITY_DN46587_c0_g1~~TRINITY_DN46587_c0_g1_i1.p1  ORF type:complete len:388 (+),score=108.10 TRINITY_DN46587_c0_g1_i1:70-1233(+)